MITRTASAPNTTRPSRSNTIKVAAHYRTDVYKEQQINRPTSPTSSSTEPLQTQSQYTWSIAAEDTIHATPTVDIVGAASYDRYAITKAEDFNATRGVFEYPKGGSDAFNGQAPVVWHYNARSEIHASVSDRARFPVIFGLYSTRFGTATPNPDLGPERATNPELGWRGRIGETTHVAGAVFYSNVRDLIQTVVLPDNPTQTQNVGNGDFYGIEISLDTMCRRN